jgi:hypothetical protein
MARMARMINGFCLRCGLQTHPAGFASNLVYLCHPRNPRFQLRNSGWFANRAVSDALIGLKIPGGN